MTYAYARVSATDQNESRQLNMLAPLNIPSHHIYVDKVSGKDFNRPAWQALAKKLAPGDTLYIPSLDRLGRNYNDIQAWWRILTKEKSIDIVVLDMPLLDTRRKNDLLGTLLSDIVLTLLSYIAHSERDTIKARQAQGIAAAKARGQHLGRPPIKTPDNFDGVMAQWQAGEIGLVEALEMTGLKRGTFYSRVRARRMREGE